MNQETLKARIDELETAIDLDNVMGSMIRLNQLKKELEDGADVNRADSKNH